MLLLHCLRILGLKCLKFHTVVYALFIYEKCCQNSDLVEKQFHDTAWDIDVHNIPIEMYSFYISEIFV